MQISESLLEQLNSQADLVGMIRKHTALKPAGREFKGCCPFHGEKTPSFYVNPETNLYYCFGCHAKGNPITFLKEFERLNFLEAVKYLSEQTGIELPKEKDNQKFQYKKTKKPQANPQNQANANNAFVNQSARNQSGNFLQNNQQASLQNNPQNQTVIHNPIAEHAPVAPDFAINEVPQDDWQDVSLTQDGQGDLYALLDNICRYYQYMLHSTPVAKQYFLDRGLTEETIAEFSLGYAPDDWQHLERVFFEDIEGLKILGLVRDSKNNGRTFDLLRNRVIFPIKDRQGRVVGFAGRSLGDEMPKYINSSESPVFQKQHILYGLHEARKMRANQYLMVEGYMDVISLYQAGIYGAVAPMGTAANENQIALLLRYHNALTLCFDGDSAGQRAAWRTLEVAAPALQDGKELRFLTLPNNHDPDTFIKTQGKDAMQSQIDHALSLSEYIYSVFVSRFDLVRPEQKAAAMAELRQLTSLFPKNSSLKWWLNNDIYQKLKDNGLGKSRATAKDLVAYDVSGDDAELQLCWCILHTPELIKSDLLAQLVASSGMDKAHLRYAKHLENGDLKVPDLPTWQTLDCPRLNSVLTAAKTLFVLQEQGLVAFNHTDEQAYFIIASLDDEILQASLLAGWRDFTKQVTNYQIQDISLLFSELLVILVRSFIQKQHENSKNLVLSEIFKKRLQALNDWDQKTTKANIASLFA